MSTGATPTTYLESIAQKEIEWTRRYGEPLELDFPHNGVFPGKKSPEDYISLLEKYLALAPYLLPRARDSPLNRPTLRHPGGYFIGAQHRKSLMIFRLEPKQHLRISGW